MIGIRNLNSYIPPSATKNRFTANSASDTSQSQTSTNVNQTQTPKNELIRTTASLGQYAEIARNNTQNTLATTSKDNLSFSTLTAINQYTQNSNLEQVEKAKSMLQLSLYA